MIRWLVDGISNYLNSRAQKKEDKEAKKEKDSWNSDDEYKFQAILGVDLEDPKIKKFHELYQDHQSKKNTSYSEIAKFELWKFIYKNFTFKVEGVDKPFPLGSIVDLNITYRFSIEPDMESLRPGVRIRVLKRDVKTILEALVPEKKK